MTAPLRLTKHHGLGNDFLIALASDNAGLAAERELAIALCDRHTGIGADGLMFGLPPDEGASGADLVMVLFNADGSEAEISGNGIRCLGQAALRNGGAREGTVVIDTLAGRRTLEIRPTSDPQTDIVSVFMGEVKAGPGLSAPSVECPALYRGTGDVGNPHVVFAVQSLAGIDIGALGPDIAAGYEGGINVHFLAPAGADAIEMLHWERGAGVTQACGSGATVAATLANEWGLVGTTVTVAMPGGEAIVDVGIGSSDAILHGPAVLIATVEVSQ